MSGALRRETGSGERVVIQKGDLEKRSKVKRRREVQREEGRNSTNRRVGEKK
jgi:hypothetical protein